MSGLPPRPDRRNHVVLLEDSRKKLLSDVPGHTRDAFAVLYTECDVIRKYFPERATFLQGWLDEHLVLSLNNKGRRFDSLVRTLLGREDVVDGAQTQVAGGWKD